jgi:hypothetical protein
MPCSLLNHAFGLHGYAYVGRKYRGGQVEWTVSLGRDKLAIVG